MTTQTVPTSPDNHDREAIQRAMAFRTRMPSQSRPSSGELQELGEAWLSTGGLLGIDQEWLRAGGGVQ